MKHALTTISLGLTAMAFSSTVFAQLPAPQSAAPATAATQPATAPAASAAPVSVNPDYIPPRNAAAPPVSGSTIRATFTVQQGQSIQAAVNRAQPGDRIEVMPGIYREAVAVDIDDITLIGVTVNGERPRFEGDNKLNDAVVVSGNNFTISGFEIRNYLGNGVVVSQAMNCVLRDLVTSNTGKYAVYPLQCDGVLVENCVSSGVWDAAIYAGQCRNVVIRNNEAYNNTVGIETENTVNAEIYNNSAHDNSLGILVVLLPNLPAKEAKNNRVVGNRIWNNNYPNKAPAGTIVSLVRPGMGIIVNAADQCEVAKNRIWDNPSYGIGLYSLSDIMEAAKIDVEPNPDGNFIHDNEFAGNGVDESKVGEHFTTVGAKGGDLFWSGKGTGNTWKETTDRVFPPNLTQGKVLPPASATAGGK